MKPIKVAFCALFAVLTIAWLAADTLLPTPFNYFSFRTVFVQYSGVICIAAMSVSMMLAARLVFIEKYLDGLDKMYRLHKWLGITALISATLHWWWAKGTKWMVSWGWLERPGRGPRPEETLSAVQQFYHSQRELAETIGEWAFYAAVVLMVLALVKYFPYHLFRRTHKWLAVLYIALAYHSLVLVKVDYWSQPVGWMMGLLICAGLISAVLVLTNRVGKNRQVSGVIQSVIQRPGIHAIEGTIKLDRGWKGHQPGQFAFVTSSPAEGPHPYTIASAWDPLSSTLTFVVKSLGDWTQQLKDRIKPGMPVQVEGPYGNFVFQDHCTQQIWVAAGIGITPFMARLEQLARIPVEQPVTLFYVASEIDADLLSRLTQNAEAAGVRLRVHHSKEMGCFSSDILCEQVPTWNQASVWFCGPHALGQQLRQDLISGGLSAGHFHQEIFNMR